LTEVDVNGAYQAQCGPNNLFDVYLVVLEHLRFLLEPSVEAKAAGCTPITMHAVYMESGPPKKVVELLPSEDITGLDIYGFTEQHGSMVSFGSHTFGTMRTAFNTAAAGAVGQAGRNYNIISNNCGDFLANVLERIGHISSPSEAKLIAELFLFADTDGFVGEVHASLMGTNMESWSDKEVMEWLVEQRLSKMYHTV
jgi:hypothetical protein